MSIETTLNVTEIQRFCMHDGPGVRTTVFLKGCPLHCAWCHNPETQAFKPELLFYPNKCIGCAACEAVCPNGVHTVGEKHLIDRAKCVACGLCAKACPSEALEISGRTWTVKELLDVIERDRAFYGAQGGVTLSGGEPTAQAEGALALLSACRARGISTAIETSGAFPASLCERLVPLVDLFLFDVKDTDDTRHRAYVGASNRPILDNLATLGALGARIRLRCILVNGVNTLPSHYRALAELKARIPGVEGIDLLPYHAYGGSKATLLGLEDQGRTEWIPSEEQLREARHCIERSSS